MTVAVELSVNSTKILVGWELVIVHSILFMFSKLLVHALNWCGGWNEEHSYVSVH